VQPVDPRYPNLRILEVSREEPADWRCLCDIVGGGYPLHAVCDLVDTSAARTPAQSLPHTRLLDLVSPYNEMSIGARWCIVECDYLDRGTSIAYATVFSRANQDYHRRTTRLHFFRQTTELSDLTSDSLLDQRSLQSGYLGFVVMGFGGTIGRAVLPPPRQRGHWTIVPCISSHSVNLSGVRLEAEGAPFAQHDGRVAACAAAAIWMSSSVIVDRTGHDLLAYSMPQITELATRYSLPRSGCGSPGLNTNQMNWALHEMGYAPLLYPALKRYESLKRIHQAVDSGIPAILIVGLPKHPSPTPVYHAVTALGYTYDPAIHPTEAIGLGRRTADMFCPHLLVHDDQKGPYLRLSVGEPDQNSGGRPRLHLDTSERLVASQLDQYYTGWYDGAYLRAVLVPLPPRHAMTLHEAEVKAGNTLVRIKDFVHARTGKSVGLPDPAIRRTYLAQSNRWKEAFVPKTAARRTGLAGPTEELARIVRGQVLSRYVWVMELFSVESRTNVHPRDWRVSAFAVIDPTSAGSSSDFLLAYVPGVVARMQPKDKNAYEALNQYIELEDDCPVVAYFDPPLADPYVCIEPISAG
jgi:hypothetical protein